MSPTDLARPGTKRTVSGASLLAISILLPWLSNGPGSSLRALDLVRHVAALDGVIPALSGGRLIVTWLSVPLSGTLLITAVGLSGAGSRTARYLARLGAFFTFVVTAVLIAVPDVGDLGVGAWVALAGAALAVWGSTRCYRAEIRES